MNVAMGEGATGTPSSPHAPSDSPPPRVHSPKRPHSAGRPAGDLYWFAQGPCAEEDNPDEGDREKEERARQLREREEKVRQLREKQDEERRKKLEELRLHAEAAEKFREQQAEERRRHIDELRSKEIERRHAVEERRRYLLEQEKERKEAIMKRNQERDVRLESKRRNEQSSIVFAFGSSTPRLASATATSRDLPLCGARRSSSTFNMDSPDGSGDKRRAASAHPFERKSEWESTSMYEILHWGEAPKHIQLFSPGCVDGEGIGEGDSMTQSMVCLSASRGRRKTDLIPTLPSPSTTSPRLAKTPTPESTQAPTSQTKKAVSMSRLDVLARPRRRPGSAQPGQDQLQSGELTPSKSTGNLSPRQGSLSAPRLTRAERLRQRARLKREESERRQHEDGIVSGMTSPSTPSRPQSAMSSASANQSQSGGVKMRPRPTSATRKPRPVSVAGSMPSRDLQKEKVGVGKQKSAEEVEIPKEDTKKEGLKRPHTYMKKVDVGKEKPVNKDARVKSKKAQEKAALSPETHEVKMVEKVPEAEKLEIKGEDDETRGERKAEEKVETCIASASEDLLPINGEINEDSGEKKEIGDPATSIGGKGRITTEEEAKAAVAEKRRQAQEERKRREEEERLAEEERIRQEEEERRRWEEEQERLIEEARRAEEERLQRAIEEAQRKGEEEQKRREEEARLKAEKEEAERRAREEKERRMQELEEQRKREEEERLARKKKLEAIMSRTRKGGGGPSSSSPTPSPSQSGVALSSLDSQESGKDVSSSLFNGAPTSLREEDQNVKNGGGAESPSTMKNGGLEDGEKSSEENNAMLLPLIHPLDAKQKLMPSDLLS